MSHYQKNNIFFRIASAGAISRFKKAQASSFLQLVRQELYFNNSAKEAVLIEYERISQWIYKIESIFLKYGNVPLTEEFSNSVIATFFDELLLIKLIIKENTVIFKSDTLEFVQLIHSYSTPILKIELSKCLIKKKPEEAFQDMLLLLENYLYHILLSIYELNNNLYAKTKPTFLCVTNFCTINTSNHNNELTPSLERLKFFKSREQIESFEIKNYSNSDSELLLDIFKFHNHQIYLEKQ